MIRAILLASICATPALATDAVGYRLGQLVDGCATALTSADPSPFQDLVSTSDMETETVAIYGYEDGIIGATVSLLYKGKSKKSGICDVSYVSDPNGIDETDELDRLRAGLAENAMEGTHVIETSMSGPVILYCRNKRGLGLFLDPKAVGKGFSAQINTVPTSRIACEGES